MKDGNVPAKRVKRWKDERDRLMKVYREKVPLKPWLRHCGNTVNLIGDMSENRMWADYAAYSYWADVIAEDFQSPQKSKNANYNAIWDNYKRFSKEGFPAYRQLPKSNGKSGTLIQKQRKLTNDVPKLSAVIPNWKQRCWLWLAPCTTTDV